MRLDRLLTTVLALVTLATGFRPAIGAAPAQEARPPRLVATADLGGTAGGAQLGDVDGDGAADAVTVRGGRVVVVTSTGRTIYDRFVGATDVAAVRDLEGDGRAEVVFLDRTIRTLEALDVTANAVRWRYQFSEAVDIAAEYVRVADVSASRPGLETIVFPDYSHSLGDAFGYFLTARGELYARPQVKSVNGNQLNFPAIAIANVDGQGDPEVVVVGRPKLLVYASTGELRSELDFRAGDPEGRHYGTLTLANVDADPELEAVVVSDRVALVTPDKSHAVAVFDLVPTVKQIWTLVTPHADVLESIPGGIADFDGDGRAEIAVDHFDGKTQAIELYAASAGAPTTPAARLADAFAWDAFDADGDGRPELFASVERDARPSLSLGSRLQILRALAGPTRLERVGDVVSGARYATRPLRVIDRTDLASSAASDRTGVVSLPAGAARSVVTYAESAGSTRMQLRRVTGRGIEVDDLGPRAGAVRAVARPDVLLVAEGAGEDAEDTLAFVRLDPAKPHVGRAASFRAAGFAEASPVAADLDGDGAPELLVRLPGRRIAVFAVDARRGTAAMRWSGDGNTRPLVDAGARPAETRIFVVAPDKRDRAMLVAYAVDGRVLWQTKFTEMPASAKPEIVLGQFTGSGPRDVWVSAPRTKSWLVDGASGRVVWESSTVFTYDNQAAVGDVDGDGADDLVVVSNLTYGVYSGRDARPIDGPVDVRQLGGDLFATPVLAGDGTVLIAGRAALAKAKVSGKDAWQVKRSFERTSDDYVAALARGRDGRVVRAGGNYGQLDRFAAFDYADGKPAFTTDDVPVTDTVAADVDGDGSDDFLFGTADGHVVALRADTGRQLWSIDVQGFAEAPVVSGHMLFVPVADGTVRIYALD
jgi:outer membrane protein assembly factor BamB